MSERAEVLDFCPGCFATNEGGSWGHGCDEHYCYNCGFGGTVKLPRWAVDSIREQASWVGKRYYPHEEDTQTREELTALRSLSPDNPTDTAEWNEDGRYYSVYRSDPKNRTRFGVMPIHAGSAEEAIRKAKPRLRYIPPEAYNEAPEATP